MQTDKRRYLPRNSRKDKATIEHGTGNAAVDGYSQRYQNRMPRDEGDPFSYRRKDSLYSENYACPGLMNDDEARMNRLYGEDT